MFLTYRQWKDDEQTTESAFYSLGMRTAFE